MHISRILQAGRSALSFEFFPPRHAAGRARLWESIGTLAAYKPDFVSVTYGAGGTTRDLTFGLVAELRRTTTLKPIPHLTCVGHTAPEISQILAEYAAMGVDNVLALRGDPPRERALPEGDFHHAGELVAAIRHHSAHRFGIGVAAFPEGHPGTPNRLRELEHLKAKVDAGADYLCTQLFFDNHDFFDFRERCELAGIHIPIVAGIMPVSSLSSLSRVAELAAGARIPARLLKALQQAQGDPAAEAAIGLAYTAAQCAELLQAGVAGLHFYTLNQAHPTLEILARLPSLGARALEDCQVCSGALLC